MTCECQVKRGDTGPTWRVGVVDPEGARVPIAGAEWSAIISVPGANPPINRAVSTKTDERFIVQLTSAETAILPTRSMVDVDVVIIGPSYRASETMKIYVE